MTRKDYKLIAAALLAANNDTQRVDHDDAVELYGVRKAALFVADALEKENPRFNRTRFLDACGFPD